MHKRTIHDVELTGQRVFIRVDFNVPLDSNGGVREDTRIRESLPTIRHALAAGGRVILASHLGRPKGKPDPAYSMRPAAARLAELLGQPVTLAPDCMGPEVEAMVAGLPMGQVLMLENLRFHKGEEANDPDFSAALARLADVIVNDAFGTAHRAHASNFGITASGKPAVAGLLMASEIHFFNKAVRAPERPVVAILGGSKVSTKIGVIEALTAKVDKLLIGGGMAFTFFKAMGYEVGNSLVEAEMVEVAARAMAVAEERGVALLLPVDAVIAEQPRAGMSTRVVSVREIPEGWMGLDIGSATLALFGSALVGVKTIIWNGPMGMFEIPEFAGGTEGLARVVAGSGALSVVGGGDTDAAVKQAGVEVSYISTGGGAFLEMLEGKELPGIQALDDGE